MKLIDILDENFNILTRNLHKEIIFKRLYSCDLLSWVLAHGKKDDILITVINNVNTIAVAYLLEIPAIIFCENSNPSIDVIKQAEDKGIVLISSKLDAATIVRHLSLKE